MEMKNILKGVMPLLIVLLMMQCVQAQESEVCMVYFTGNCGDECTMSESFIQGLINEYSGKLTAIKYNVESSQENMNIFNAYRSTYNLPYGIPMLLFGENDYILGGNNIFKHSEPRIYGLITSNGTNCPLESGYVPPGDVVASDLPGDPEFYRNESGEIGGEPGVEGNGIPDGQEQVTGDEDTPALLIELRKIIEDPLLSVLILVLAVVIAVLFFTLAKWLRRS